MKRGGCVYIMTNKNHTTLYVGVTSALYDRVYEHKNKIYKNSFTAKYNLTQLVWYESYGRIEEAISFEKIIKTKSRSYKIELINKSNPDWKDLWGDELL